MYQINNQYISLFERSGWSSSRHVDLSGFLVALKEMNIDISVNAIEFLEAFEGLEILLPNNEVAFEFKREDLVHEWIRKAVTSEQESVEQFHGEKVDFIGQAENRHMFVYLSEKGKILGTFEGEIYTMGEDIFDAINKYYDRYFKDKNT